MSNPRATQVLTALLILLLLAGCTSLKRVPLSPDPSDETQKCRTVPSLSRDGHYVVLLVDPVYSGIRRAGACVRRFSSAFTSLSFASMRLRIVCRGLQRVSVADIVPLS